MEHGPSVCVLLTENDIHLNEFVTKLVISEKGFRTLWIIKVLSTNIIWNVCQALGLQIPCYMIDVCLPVPCHFRKLQSIDRPIEVTLHVQTNFHINWPASQSHQIKSN